MYPSVEIANVSLGSRPFFNKGQGGNYNRKNRNNKNKKDLISKIEITLKMKSYI